jgi:hypothetical protein
MKVNSLNYEQNSLHIRKEPEAYTSSSNLLTFSTPAVLSTASQSFLTKSSSSAFSNGSAISTKGSCDDVRNYLNSTSPNFVGLATQSPSVENTEIITNNIESTNASSCSYILNIDVTRPV